MATCDNFSKVQMCYQCLLNLVKHSVVMHVSFCVYSVHLFSSVWGLETQYLEKVSMATSDNFSKVQMCDQCV